ncbi:glucose-1-phosphate thymidylyltransferase [Candidatus Nitrosarchaeum limnium]|uniref:Glucose-1-phosphate thymidylyltransferase n=1 Tax=Candidatus Nitrosarchaeum limnium BG20 TaxID=859192 RepID=S2E774_9ARCH|nr:glucose-1-phosphate thymidylyltransferase [Candidatus Nitrosarchaeum limnium]EPA05326.1 glucose-1-phosphate thymidylyltransferase [Candidatus Nitrosarchaeum limnium BG20]
MKGIILHGGHGTRLRPLTHTGPKQLIKIANKPMSQYVLEDLRDAGIIDIAIIIGDVYPEKVKEFYGNGKKFGVNLTYIYQNKPHGIAHAISLCKDFIGENKFVVYLGDNILRTGLLSYVQKFESSSKEAQILLAEVENPSAFGVVKIKDNKILHIIEKPKEPPSNFAVIGVYFLTPKIFKIIKQLKPSWRGELEITEALQLLMDSGFELDHDYVTGWWKDTGTPNDILHANKLILESMSIEIKNTDGIFIGKNCIIDSESKIIGPVIIDDNCVISSSIIGPYVSIGKNSFLKNCQIKNSIIMDNCIIDTPIKIINSIIADETEINSSESKESTYLLGERSKIML